jgi:ribosome-binding protein aMBF1 (putative translation factor)
MPDDDWVALRERRLAEPGAGEAYQAARLAHELGCADRTLRERRGSSQSRLARSAGMTQSAVARLEAGGAIPTVPVLDRLAHALGAELVVRLRPGPAFPDRPPTGSGAVDTEQAQ